MQMTLHPRTANAAGMQAYSARAGWRIIAAAVLFAVAACGGKAFQPNSGVVADLRSRSEVQTEDGLTVRAAVPGPDETRRLFGASLYGRGVQPVWLEVENRSTGRVRFAPTGADPEYFSPLEVAYVHRGGFSGEARAAMESYYHAVAMPRFIEPGETDSGFVFTNARPGTKAFNVDLFGAERNDHSFTFFVDVPGFIPDHAEVDFAGLYAEDEIANLDAAELRAGLRRLPRHTTDATGKESREPVNVVFVGHGVDLRAALLRADWQETAAQAATGGSPADRTRYLFGRPPDAVLRKRRGKDDRNELLIWLAPMRAGGRPVWLAQVTHQLPGLFGIVYQDPDIDEARYYLLQSLWYGQSLTRLAWRAAVEPTPASEPVLGFRRGGYFTDGFQIVVWPSGDPVSLLEVERQRWDQGPRTGRQ